MRLRKLGRNKVVFILNASRGVGFNFVEQYANEPGTVVIAGSSSMGKHTSVSVPTVDRVRWVADILRNSTMSLGDTPASIQCEEELNLTWPHQKLADRIRAMGQQNGPITHLFEVGGLPNNGVREVW